MCVCWQSLAARFLERERDQHFLTEIKQGGGISRGVIAKHGSNSEKRSRDREEEEGSGIEGTCERYR